MASLAVREGNGSLVWAFARMVIRLFQAAIFRRSPSQILETFCFIFIQFYLHYSFIFMARLCNIQLSRAEDQVESRLKPEKKRAEIPDVGATFAHETVLKVELPRAPNERSIG